MNYRLWI